MINYSSTTKLVTCDPEFERQLPPSEVDNYNKSVLRVNRLLTELVNTNGDNPPPPNFLTKPITVSAAKLVENAVKNLKANKPEDAIKIASTALEMVLRRPLFESVQVLTTEVHSVLQVRCDAYIMAKKLDFAYADAELLSMLNPLDANSVYRKAVIMYVSKEYATAFELLTQACDMKKGNSMYQKLLTKCKAKLKASN